ncbi:hypothetical protein [Amycolatopsis sp. NBC_01480]|uniref:hypothetical protein n=1 Tax=Amycolatopsis sp. NBC_01480 TaxID=2903562 RepID=UPI002E27ACEF|nr:hypothetical protein [Amycolatopsis sp. NBC_01480]
MAGIVPTVSTLAAVAEHDPIFAICLAIVTFPLAITLNARLLADLFSLPAQVNTHIGLLVRKVAVTCAIGFVLAVLQVVTGAANILSSNALSLTIAVLAGVGAWPHAIEAHYTVRQKLLRRTQRQATRGRSATPRSMVQLNRPAPRCAAHTVRRRVARPSAPMPASASFPPGRVDVGERRLSNILSNLDR